MASDHAFVDLRRVFFNYTRPVNPLLRLTGRRGVTHPALRDVSLKLNQGDWVTLYGASGAGKSTLLRLLAGELKPSRGQIMVNGRPPRSIRRDPPPARLSHSQQRIWQLERMLKSDDPLILLDDIADELGPDETLDYLKRWFRHRTVIVSTRFAATAEALNLPVIVLHSGTLAHHGTPAEIADTVALPRVIDIWLEGIRYDLFRSIKKHPGVVKVSLLPDSRFNGQRLCVTLKSGRYLPALYDIVTQASLIRVEEQPVSLTDILSHLRRK